MDRGGILSLLIVLGLVGVAVAVLTAPPWLIEGSGESACEGTATDHEIDASGDRYDRTTVTLQTPNGTQLGTVDVRIADTEETRYTGLSDTESLGEDEGMLFVHPDEGRYAYVMRRMDFPLDIVFVDAEGTITTIHHAPVPEEISGGDGRFPGEAKYVLEVNRGWTNATGVDAGDCVGIPDGVTAT